jgi:hypothetical protein
MYNMNIMRKIPQKTYLPIIVLIVLFGIAVYYRWVRPVPQGTTVYHCSDFRTQTVAQRIFLTNVSKYAYLDGNHDGKACNGLPL